MFVKRKTPFPLRKIEILPYGKCSYCYARTDDLNERKAYLHLFDEIVGAEYVVVLVWVLFGVLLRPEGLPSPRQPNHHQDLNILQFF
jgi:hypothetical protein